MQLQCFEPTATNRFLNGEMGTPICSGVTAYGQTIQDISKAADDLLMRPNPRPDEEARYSRAKWTSRKPFGDSGLDAASPESLYIHEFVTMKCYNHFR